MAVSRVAVVFRGGSEVALCPGKGVRNSQGAPCDAGVEEAGYPAAQTATSAKPRAAARSAIKTELSSHVERFIAPARRLLLHLTLRTAEARCRVSAQ